MSGLVHLDHQMGLVIASLELQLAVATNDDQRILRAMAALADARGALESDALDANTHAELLAQRFGLSASELSCIWLLVGVALKPSIRNLLKFVTGETGHDPTLAGIKTAVYGERSSREALRELGPSGSLQRFGLIERTDGEASAHVSRQTWAVADRVLQVLHGETGLDAQLAGICRIRDESPGVENLAVAADLERLGRALSDQAAVVLLAGLPSIGRRSTAWSVARARGKELLEVELNRLPRDASFATALRSVVREAMLLGRQLLFADLESLHHERDSKLQSFADIIGSLVMGPILVTTSNSPPTVRWDRSVLRVDFALPKSAARATHWHRELGCITAEDAGQLAELAPLVPGLAHRAAKSALALANGELAVEHVVEGIRNVTSDALSRYAKRVTTSQDWSDIVLSNEHADAVEDLLRRVRGRRKVYEDWGFAAKVGKGLGISALFSGPPGTGKTMVAALIAKDLHTDLFQVDTSKIVSKYIGETEKNLAALFDAADATNAILLFDEADSLFGKRTDVKSSNDRNANLETNFLLQRLETFQGVCLLTTNHESHLDPAFQRRLSVHLRFAIPEAWERAHLWKAMLPADAPVEASVAFDELADKYAMSGGYIRNAVLRAAFMAAHAKTSITQQHLRDAARAEYDAMGKLSIASD